MRDCRNEFIRNLKYSMMGIIEQSNLDKVMANVIGLLDAYELSERVTALTVREDVNANLIKMYISSLMLDGKSKNTAYVYLRNLNRFCTFIGNQDLEQVKTFDVRNYLTHEKVRGLSNVSIENIRTNLNAFYQWMTNEEYISKNPCAGISPIKCHVEIKQPFSIVEQDALKNHCDTLKERAMIEVLLTSGVRVSELIGLDVSDIDYTNKSVHVRHGKGDKERYTYINDLALSYLVKYLTDSCIETGPLFLNQRKGRYTSAGIRYMLNQIADRAKVQNVYPHRFRRTFATTLASRGMDVQDIQTLMGHTDINTTMGYITMNDTKVNNSYKKYNM